MKRIVIFFTAIVISQFVRAQQSVGIGTTSPNASAQLDVTSTTKGLLIPRMTSAQRLAITVSPTTAGLMVYETTTNSFWFYNGTAWSQMNSGGASLWTASGNNIYNNNSGNVGIGLSSNLNEKLTLKGNALLVHPDGFNVVLSLMGNTNNSSRIHFIRPDSSQIGSIFGWDLTDNLYLQAASNTNQLVLDQNSFVGIKTSTPTKALDVVGSIRSRDTITADDDIVAGDNISAGNKITAGGTIVAASTIQGGAFLSTGDMLLGGKATVVGDVQSNSEVVILGNSATLHLKDASSADKGFVQLSGDNLRVGTYSSNTTGKFVVRTGGADQVYIDQNGNMGFGVSTPISRLQILSGDDASLSTHGYIMLGSVTGSNLIFDNNEIMARSNGTIGNLVLQNDGGTVRIGNVAVPSGYKFAVNGKMLCEELRVKLAANWPDYVFKNDYKLLPLAELKKFIEQNNHLPNIPRAEVIEKEGMEVGDMQKKMMEKIEELTLYILDLQKQIDELKKKNSGN